MAFKKIGILGGMGPEASANFYYKIIHYCQKNYHAVQDTDFPPLIIYSLPLFGFDESGIVDKKLVLQQLIHGVDILKNAGCDFVVIPCNTVHLFINDLRKNSSIPILCIMEETVKKMYLFSFMKLYRPQVDLFDVLIETDKGEAPSGNVSLRGNEATSEKTVKLHFRKLNKYKKIKQDNLGVVGLLGSDTTLKLQLYLELLNKNNICCISPKEEENPIITQLILEVMSGKVENKTKNNVLSIIKKMEQQSANAIVLGCTEIPLAISQKDVNIKVYDTLQILAESAVDFAINDDPIMYKNQTQLLPSVDHAALSASLRGI